MKGERRIEKITDFEDPLCVFSTNFIQTRLAGHVVCWERQEIHITKFISRIKIDQLDVTCVIISLFNAQHVSDVNTSILRRLRLISWAVFLWFDVCWC